MELSCLGFVGIEIKPSRAFILLTCNHHVYFLRRNILAFQRDKEIWRIWCGEECVSLKSPSALNSEIHKEWPSNWCKFGGHLLLSESKHNRKSRFSTIRQEGVGFRNSPQNYFSTLPVRTDLGRNDATMRPQRGFSIRYPYKVTFPIKRRIKVRYLK